MAGGACREAAVVCSRSAARVAAGVVRRWHQQMVLVTGDRFESRCRGFSLLMRLRRWRWRRTASVRRRSGSGGGAVIRCRAEVARARFGDRKRSRGTGCTFCRCTRARDPRGVSASAVVSGRELPIEPRFFGNFMQCPLYIFLAGPAWKNIRWNLVRRERRSENLAERAARLRGAFVCET